MDKRLRGFSSRELLARSFPLLGRVAFVGGGSGQLGSATVDRLCSLGCSVLFTYSSNHMEAGKVMERNSRFFEKHSLKSKVIAINASSERLKKIVAKEFGRLDFILCFQDLYFKKGLWNGSDNEIVENEKHLPYEIAYVGTRDTIEALVPLMKNGSILIVSSTTAIAGAPYKYGKHYSIPKAYLIELAKKYAKALAKRNITVNVGIWGWVPKGVEDPKELKAELKKIPLMRFGKPDDIAQACYLIITSRWMTGQGIIVDGGQTMTVNAMPQYLKEGKRLFDKYKKMSEILKERV